MAPEDHSRQTPSTDDQDTADFGTAPQSGILLKDRYLLIRQLNEGGFGTVHLASDQQMHGRLVVVKIQINQRVDDPWFERKFSEEVRALSMIDHPGVVMAIDSGRTPDGKPFLVMQYVDGVTLRAVMSADGMPLDRVAEILKQVGHALFAAHEKGVWHRDLKPENLMLQTLSGTGERVRLIDFGIATVADLKNKYLTTTRVAGSFLYMAPEQVMGQPSALTDIYAMGLIAYEMVTGRKPFLAENTVQLVALQKAGVRVKPTDLRPSLPAAAERLILQSLEYEPSKRPKDARAFGDQLHDALLDPDATRITARAGRRTGAWKKWTVAGAAVLALALATGIFIQRGRRDAAPPVAAPARKPDTPKLDATAEQAIELAFWNSVKDSTEPQLYREYLLKYPQGRFASLANAKLEILARKTVPKQAANQAKADNTAAEEEVELAFWNAVKDGTEPELYQDYLDKYPHGRFESVARTKLDILSRKGHDRSARGGFPKGGPVPPGVPDLRNLSAYDPKTAAELSDWNALKDAKGAQPYRDYLAKYPQGMFAPVAKFKIAAFEKGVPPDFPPPGDVPPPLDDQSGPDERRRLPPMRKPIDTGEYNGPQQGELRWSGQTQKGHSLIIQGGKPSAGILTGDLPRVPVTVELVGAGKLLEAPSAHNRWDRLVIRTSSDSPGDISIRWKVAK